MLTTRRRGADCAGVACEHTLGRQPLHLYGYLWTKPEFLVDAQSGGFSFVVPDTVLFKQQKPVKWFFTSRQEKGKILTKSKKNVNVAEVLQAFLEQPRHLSTSAHDPTNTEAASEDDAIVATYVYPDRSSNGELVMVVEHLTRTGLQRLLTEREKPPISVLQRFIPTRSGYNHLIQSVFTPDSCLLRKCVNANVVSDTRLCLPGRVATFEADERLVKPRDVTNRELRDQIEHMHLEMSTHLKKIIGKPVARNVAYFKHGADGRIYLLWSTMLSFETGNLAFAKNMRLSLSPHDRLQHLIATTPGSQLLTDKTRSAVSSPTSKNPQMKMCPGCRSNFPASLVDFVATFKAIICAFVADPSRPNNSCVPPLLESVLPPTSDERFKELSSRKEFLYRTIALCQPCAKRISSTKTKKAKPATAIRISRAFHATTTKSDHDRPIYMQSAHTIFWGKVEREEAARVQSGRALTPQLRPRSAILARPSARMRTFAALSRQALPSGLPRPSLDCLLPDLAGRRENVRVVEPKHCVQTLAEHLGQTFGSPSARLALARANIYPSTPQVSTELLQRIAEPRLLADVVAYWSEVSKINGVNSITGTIDLDSLDAMLSKYSVATPLSSRIGRPIYLQRDDATPTDPQVSHNRAPGSFGTPVPPAARRPSSCGATRPISSKAYRLVHHSQPRSTISRPARAANIGSDGAHFKTPPGNRVAHTENSEMALPSIIIRSIDGIACEVHVAAVGASDAQSLDLSIHAFPLRGASAKQEKADGLSPDALELTLHKEQILNIVACSPPPVAGVMPVPPTGEALVRMVLDGLAIQEGRLFVRPAESLRAAPAIPVPHTNSPSNTADACLTADELRLLRETLRRN